MSNYRRLAKKLVWILLITLGVLSCRAKTGQALIPEYLEEIELPSLDYLFDASISEAQKWDAEAQIVRININLYPDKIHNHHLASMVFQSPNREFDYLYIQIFQDGSILSEEGSYHFPVEEKDFIDIKNIIDAPQAWGNFLKNPDVVDRPPEDFECGKLLLFRESNGQRFIWRLGLGTGICYAGEGELAMFHIDAETGDFIQSP